MLQRLTTVCLRKFVYHSHFLGVNKLLFDDCAPEGLQGSASERCWTVLTSPWGLLLFDSGEGAATIRSSNFCENYRITWAFTAGSFGTRVTLSPRVGSLCLPLPRDCFKEGTGVFNVFSPVRC